MKTVATVTLPKAGEFAIVPMAEYRRLTKRDNQLSARHSKRLSEDQADAFLAARGRKNLAAYRRGEIGATPAEVIEATLIKGVNPVRAWRKYRKLTLVILADKIGIASSYLTQIELGQRRGSVDIYRRLAKVLGAELDELAPK